ncbi:hypothetical protein ACA910_012373 [Epithemia clementina (nom. ined.)]
MMMMTTTASQQQHHSRLLQLLVVVLWSFSFKKNVQVLAQDASSSSMQPPKRQQSLFFAQQKREAKNLSDQAPMSLLRGRGDSTQQGSALISWQKGDLDDNTGTRIDSNQRGDNNPKEESRSKRQRRAMYGPPLDWAPVAPSQSPAPTPRPLPRPTRSPTPRPTHSPTPRPTHSPTPRPTHGPAPRETPGPTGAPTPAPPTLTPMSLTTTAPPTWVPSDTPNSVPSDTPPTSEPPVSSPATLDTNVFQEMVVEGGYVHTCNIRAPISFEPRLFANISYSYPLVMATGADVDAAVLEGERRIGQGVAEHMCSSTTSEDRSRVGGGSIRRHARVLDENAPSYLLRQLNSFPPDTYHQEEATTTNGCGTAVAGTSCRVVHGQFAAAVYINPNADATQVTTDIETKFQDVLGVVLLDVMTHMEVYGALQQNHQDNNNGPMGPSATFTGGSDKNNKNKGLSNDDEDGHGPAFYYFVDTTILVAGAVGLLVLSFLLVFGRRQLQRRRQQQKDSEHAKKRHNDDKDRTNLHDSDDSSVPVFPLDDDDENCMGNSHGTRCLEVSQSVEFTDGDEEEEALPDHEEDDDDDKKDYLGVQTFQPPMASWIQLSRVDSVSTSDSCYATSPNDYSAAASTSASTAVANNCTINDQQDIGSVYSSEDSSAWVGSSDILGREHAGGHALDLASVSQQSQSFDQYYEISEQGSVVTTHLE